ARGEQGGEHLGRVGAGTQLRRDSPDAGLHPGQQRLRVGVVQIFRERGDDVQPGLAEGRGEGLVDLRGHAGRTLFGDGGRERVHLLVVVVLDPHTVRVPGVERHHLRAELRRQHDRGVVLVRPGALEGVLRRGDLPVQLVVGPQGGEQLVAHIDAQREQLALIALVGAGDGHLQVLRDVERVPAREHVEPREQRRDHDASGHDDNRPDVRRGPAQVLAEKPPDVRHPDSPRSSSGSSGSSGPSWSSRSSAGPSGSSGPSWSSSPPGSPSGAVSSGSSGVSAASSSAGPAASSSVVPAPPDDGDACDAPASEGPTRTAPARSSASVRRSSASDISPTSVAIRMLCRVYSSITRTPATSRPTTTQAVSTTTFPIGASQPTSPTIATPASPARAVPRTSVGYRRVNRSSRARTPLRYSSRFTSASMSWDSRCRPLAIWTSSLTSNPVSAILRLNIRMRLPIRGRRTSPSP